MEMPGRYRSLQEPSISYMLHARASALTKDGRLGPGPYPVSGHSINTVTLPAFSIVFLSETHSCLGQISCRALLSPPKSHNGVLSLQRPAQVPISFEHWLQECHFFFLSGEAGVFSPPDLVFFFFGEQGSQIHTPDFARLNGCSVLWRDCVLGLLLVLPRQGLQYSWVGQWMAVGISRGLDHRYIVFLL